MTLPPAFLTAVSMRSCNAAPAMVTVRPLKNGEAAIADLTDDPTKAPSCDCRSRCASASRLSLSDAQALQRLDVMTMANIEMLVKSAR